MPEKKKQRFSQMKKQQSKAFEVPIPLKEELSETQLLTGDISHDASLLQKATGNSADIIYKTFHINPQSFLFIYTEGLANQQTIRNLLEYLMSVSVADYLEQLLVESRIPIGSTKELLTAQEALSSLLVGHSVLIIAGIPKGIAIDTNGIEHRTVSEPQNQTVIKGPQEAFNETLVTNIALVRKRIRHPNLWTERMEIGDVTKTAICIMYVKNLANEDIVNEVRRRLKQIKTDSILESGYIEEFIADQQRGIFPTMFNTERPDVIAADLLEGKVAIFVDGTPYVLSAPAVFIQFFQAAEDYYNRGDYGMLRMLRFACFFITLLAPALYIALTTYHQEMLPTTLLISIAAQRDAIPFPAFIEALLMQFTFEILREAGIRMPRAIGNAVSIVGALVLGEAAVQAGFVSPAMVIVISITALTTFISPDFAMSFPQRILRIILMLLGASFGLFGIVVGLFAVLLHLCHLQSFGVPYMSPLGPFNRNDQQDTFLRLPRWAMHKRPKMFHSQNEIRTATKQGDET
jgi:spore germination protein KA